MHSALSSNKTLHKIILVLALALIVLSIVSISRYLSWTSSLSQTLFAREYSDNEINVPRPSSNPLPSPIPTQLPLPTQSLRSSCGSIFNYQRRPYYPPKSTPVPTGSIDGGGYCNVSFKCNTYPKEPLQTEAGLICKVVHFTDPDTGEVDPFPYPYIECRYDWNHQLEGRQCRSLDDWLRVIDRLCCPIPSPTRQPMTLPIVTPEPI